MQGEIETQITGEKQANHFIVFLQQQHQKSIISEISYYVQTCDELDILWHVHSRFTCYNICINAIEAVHHFEGHTHLSISGNANGLFSRNKFTCSTNIQQICLY